MQWKNVHNIGMLRAGRASFFCFEVQLAVTDGDCVGAERFLGRSADHRSIADPELGVMPGAGEKVAVQSALVERRAGVGASRVQTEELAVEVDDQDLLASEVEVPHLPWGYVLRGAQLEVIHSRPFQTMIDDRSRCLSRYSHTAMTNSAWLQTRGETETGVPV